MPGDDDDDERMIETQRLVQELTDVRKRMQKRAEQPPLRSSLSGAFRAQRPSPPPNEPATSPSEDKVAEEEPAPPTRRRP